MAAPKKSLTRRLLPVAAALAIAGYFWQRQASADAPACTWRVGTGTEIKQAKNYDELPAESPFRLAFTAIAPTYVYVFSHSIVDGTLLLWPSADLKSDLAQPLPTGMATLPGKTETEKSETKELAWTTRSQVQGTSTVVVIAALQPLPELEAILPKLRRWSNSVMPDRSMLVTKPALGETPLAPPLSSELPSELLRRAAGATISLVHPNGPMPLVPGFDDVWCSSWRFVEKKGQ
ncbi:MAG: hypothetical protein H6838_08555 [Planctomycetes bacterium]|nr:hypothetical protein [Planctomycetota bacterium]MCB9885529.1 hypothetical protein [Planctomycetota bacterium]